METMSVAAGMGMKTTIVVADMNTETMSAAAGMDMENSHILRHHRLNRRIPIRVFPLDPMRRQKSLG